jgi:chaperonin GroES
MAFTPMSDRVLVKFVDRKKKSDGGIYIPDSAQEKSSEGEVVAVGPGRVTDAGKMVKPTLKAGDRVFLSKYAGTEIILDGVLHLVLQESEIIGVFSADT